MVSVKSISAYQGLTLKRGDRFVYLPPNPMLRPYIANYTLTFPTPETMPDEYTVLPSASTTLCLSVHEHHMETGFCGVNASVRPVGAFANKAKLLLLVEFHPGGLHPFLKMDQHELLDVSMDFSELDRPLARALEVELLRSSDVQPLVDVLDQIFLKRLEADDSDALMLAARSWILARNGDIGMNDLSDAFHYSETHLRRIFRKHVGTTPKVFSKIARLNHALALMRRQPSRLTDIAMASGYYDQPHFIHDFHSIFGITPRTYLENMAVFYNDEYKM